MDNGLGKQIDSQSQWDALDSKDRSWAIFWWMRSADARLKAIEGKVRVVPKMQMQIRLLQWALGIASFTGLTALSALVFIGIWRVFGA